MRTTSDRTMGKTESHMKREKRFKKIFPCMIRYPGTALERKQPKPL